jgi:iron complex transport system substrate-binding protein
MNQTSRPRPWRLLVVLLLSAVLLVACGDDAPAGDGAEPATADQEAEAAPEVFPVEVEHTFGTTTVEDQPERIVSIGYQEHDALYALGADPVAVRYWFGDTEDVIFPWAEDAAGDADPEILNMPYGALNYEAIAALQPDLIMGIYSGITEEEYGTLSQIAPTVAQPADYPTYGIPWQVSLEITGHALGRSEEASTLIEALEAQFAEAADAHPEWEGEPFAVVAASRADGVAVFASFDPRARFFASLGFEPLPEVDDLAGEEFYAELSAENIDVVDGGLIVWDQLSYVDGGRATVDASPLVANMQSTQAGTVTDTSGDVEAAFGFNTVLSLPYVLEVMVPRLEAAMDGDPSTTS